MVLSAGRPVTVIRRGDSAEQDSYPSPKTSPSHAAKMTSPGHVAKVTSPGHVVKTSDDVRVPTVTVNPSESSAVKPVVAIVR